MENQDNNTIHSRKLISELSIINRTDGSVKFSQGETSGELNSQLIKFLVSSYSLSIHVVTCGIYGPVEVKGSREQHDQASLEVIVRQETGVQGSVEYQLEGLIGTLCEDVVMTTQHPRSAISVTVQINSNKGSVSTV